MKLKLKSTNINIREDYKNGAIDKCGVVLGRDV